MAKPKKTDLLGKTAHDSAQPTTAANNSTGLTKLEHMAGTIAGHVAASDKSLLPEVVAQFSIEIAMQIIIQIEQLASE